MAFNIILIYSTLILVNALQTESKVDSKSDDSAKVSTDTKEINVCEILDRNSKVQCYCIDDNFKDVPTTIKAECWIFNGNITEKDPVWNGFKGLTFLQKLSFHVRSDGSLHFIPKVSLDKLHHLKTFEIKYGNISTIPEYAFANLTSIDEINLAHLEVRTLSAYAFAYLDKLTVLTLDENHITEIGRDVFFKLPALQKLYFTNNNISIVHDGAFKYLTALTELEIDRNAIFVITRQTFRGLASLRRLEMSGNHLEFIGDDTFEETPKLEDLLLDNNKIKMISENAFRGLQKLRRLSLGENKLVELNGEALFQDLHSMVMMDLRSNKLKTLTREVMGPIMKNFESAQSTMYLEENPFECDCRLLWLAELQNRTKSERLRQFIDNTICRIDDDVRQKIETLNQKAAGARTAPADGLNSTDYDTNEGPYSEEYYDDAADAAKSLGGQNYYFLNIPRHLLPCPGRGPEEPVEAIQSVQHSNTISHEEEKEDLQKDATEAATDPVTPTSVKSERVELKQRMFDINDNNSARNLTVCPSVLFALAFSYLIHYCLVVT